MKLYHLPVELQTYVGIYPHVHDDLDSWDPWIAASHPSIESFPTSIDVSIHEIIDLQNKIVLHSMKHPLELTSIVEPITFHSSTHSSFQVKEEYGLTLQETQLLHQLHENEKKNPIRNCAENGCINQIRRGKYCQQHGGSKRCIAPGCTKGSQGGYLCIGHGGGRKCSVEGCHKSAQSNYLCKKHGGGVRCHIPGCNKSSQGNRKCRRHGGGKRCQIKDCLRGAQRGKYCAKHGGFRYCQAKDCTRTDRGGGYCEAHRRDKLCTQKGCKKLSKSMGLCSTHLRSNQIVIQLHDNSPI